MEKPTSSSANVQTSTASMLVETVADLMSLYMQSGYLNNLSVFSDLCFSLAKGIDHAVANNEVPLRSNELPPLLSQVYNYRNDFSLQEASMVLMMSVKCACKVGWFQNEDANDMLKLIQEVSRYFSSTEDVAVDPSYVHPYVSKVIRRFYPKLKLGWIIAAFQIKPGFGNFLADFHIIKGMVTPGKDEIWFLLANIDNMEAAYSIIAPPEASFLLNGKGLEGASKGSIPQLPINITKMLKYGVNLLRAVGQFNGHYIAVIGIMSLLPSLESHGIRDCSRPLSLARSDLETVENTSTVSLDCPISNSWQVQEKTSEKVVNGSWKPILQDNYGASSQTNSKSQCIEQLRHKNKHSMNPATLDKTQRSNKPRILVHASVPVTSIKTNATAGSHQQTKRTFPVPSRLAPCGESSGMYLAMVNQRNE